MSRNESDTRAELIEPALKLAGWGAVEGSKIKRERIITPGMFSPFQKISASLIADFVLLYKDQELVVIEAKSEDKSHTEGLQQAKLYAEKLNIRFVASTNGKLIRWVDMITGEENDIDVYPTPYEVWEATFNEANEWRYIFLSVPFYQKAGGWSLRYYQEVAINKAMEAVANNQNRILLTLATAAGKTDIAFQIAWKLFKGRWTLLKDRIRSPRILFLADRNALADQAYRSFDSYNAFSEGALLRVLPDEIKKLGTVPQNATVFFTIFQTFMSGGDDNLTHTEYYKSYPQDYFDVIFIDECHRGGANDESSWRDILEYFSPALQIGLTATPKRSNNVDTYAYFGEPVYVYSLKMGINDGYLSPYKLYTSSSNVDEYELQADDVVLEGEAEIGQLFSQRQLNTDVLIKQREEGRIIEFLKHAKTREKTIVFCGNQERARYIRDLFNQFKTDANPNYCVRITANEGHIGDQMLRVFQDNDKLFPVIVTTSHKLSTGIDARNVRNIVFFREAQDMIEFKQIIGRGSRLFDNKYYFTIYDFAGTSDMFKDPEWDGLPLEFLDGKSDQRKRSSDVDEKHDAPAKPPKSDDNENDSETKNSSVIQLSDGTARSITFVHTISFLDAEGMLINAQQFIINIFGELPLFFNNKEELRELWSNPEKRNKLLSDLAEKGFPLQQLSELRHAIDADNCDIYDVLAFIKFNSKPQLRIERANHVRNSMLPGFSALQQDFINLILEQYVNHDFTELEQEKLPDLIKLRFQTVHEGFIALGNKEKAMSIFRDIQILLYERT
ncbi:MAG: DEAD/DEAH box helicase family protein [Endomicrobium sp.]|jgi:type I restriction enzyme R subunit|nr:DEAD/DEAH box helicase family protein [Endomicrobium sp.]